MVSPVIALCTASGQQREQKPTTIAELRNAIEAVLHETRNRIQQRNMISFIVPAHNEQASLGRTLEAIHKAARAVGQPYEIIVVDDASTDATPEIAAQNNARVLSVNHRQIAATGIPARAPRKASGCFSWMRTRQSMRALSPRRFELWTTARLAALRQRDLTPLRRFTRTCCCGGLVC